MTLRKKTQDCDQPWCQTWGFKTVIHKPADDVIAVLHFVCVFPPKKKTKQSEPQLHHCEIDSRVCSECKSWIRLFIRWCIWQQFARKRWRCLNGETNGFKMPNHLISADSISLINQQTLQSTTHGPVVSNGLAVSGPYRVWKWVLNRGVESEVLTNDQVQC